MSAHGSKNVGQIFQDRFGGSAAYIVRAPGRVNLIGEHIDYNGGLVLPMAIDRDVRVAIRPSQTPGTILAYSAEYEDDCSFPLDKVEEYKGKISGWGRFVLGAVGVLQSHGYAIQGSELAISGNVPIGAGLSSSAATSVALITALRQGGKADVISPNSVVRMAQQIEHQYIGTNCGIMDQYISYHACLCHALRIDCARLEDRPVPLPTATHSVVITDSHQSRELANGAYNERVGECQELLAFLSKKVFKCQIPNLAGVSEYQYQRHRQVIEEAFPGKPHYRRGLHVVTEQLRVINAADALNYSNVQKFGELMNESHNSLRDNYEVSSKPLDVLVEAARRVPGCLGSRLTGAGFGGCTVSLVENERVDTFKQQVATAYNEAGYPDIDFYVSQAAQGVTVIKS